MGGHSHLVPLRLKKARKRSCFKYFLLLALQIPLKYKGLDLSRKEKGENETDMVLILADIFRNKNKTHVNTSVNYSAAQVIRRKFCLGRCNQKNRCMKKDQLKASCTTQKCVHELMWINKGNKKQPKVRQAGRAAQESPVLLLEMSDIRRTSGLQQAKPKSTSPP